MKTAKKYRDTLLSLLCVISWFVLVIRIFRKGDSDLAFGDLIFTCLLTSGVAVVGGIILIFVAMFKQRKLKFHFIYNLFGTLNIVIGSLCLFLFSSAIKESLYIGAASITVGIVIYTEIYNDIKIN